MFTTTDNALSKRVITHVFDQQSPTMAQKHSFDVLIPPVFRPRTVLVGGGAIVMGGPNAYITASCPTDDRRGWHVESRDHYVPSPHFLIGFAIGMEIRKPPDDPEEPNFYSSDVLSEWVTYRPVRSAPGQRPVASSDLGDPDFQDRFMLIGGGFRIEPEKAHLATASHPEFAESWVARSKDHGQPVSAWVESWAIGLKILPTLRKQTETGEVEVPLGKFRRTVTTAVTPAPSSTPEAKTFLNKQYALTGIGAEARTPEPGALLWKLGPSGDFVGGADTASKDHQWPAEGVIKAWAIGVGLDKLESLP
ncbi:hypothetical protein [Nocardia testacea]|uniref:Uncharacterized protein n=1 Tax=Nocardia testacea TaxID=248551 RepID=A0ABW7VZV1_9NOCA